MPNEKETKYSPKNFKVSFFSIQGEAQPFCKMQENILSAASNIALSSPYFSTKN
jgi:hypothetical protein